MFPPRDKKSVSHFARFCALIFALLQLAAPTWHVCALGGNAASTRGALMSCHGAIVTENASDAEVRAMRVAYRLYSVEAPPKVVLDTNAICLAQLLNTMGSEAATSPLLQLSFTSRVLARENTPHFVSKIALPQPPARGPPTFSV
jgi:hypothetical protein